MKKLLSFLLVAVLGISLVACSSSQSSATNSSSGSSGQSKDNLKVKPSRIRVVIGSTSTGGDTYQNAQAISMYAEKLLGTNMKVDAIGDLPAFQALSKAKNDGSTIMFFHDQAYLGVVFGNYPEKYDLDHWTVGPVVSVNPGNAFLAKADAPYNTMAEAAEWLKNNPSKTIKVAIQAGGVSEFSFDAWYLWVKDKYGTDVAKQIKVYVTGSQDDKNKALWDGNVEIINGSIGGNAEYTKDGIKSNVKMKFLGITSGKRVEGYDIPTFAEQGIEVDGQPFKYDKEFFFLMPKNVDPKFASKLDQAVKQVEKDPAYIQQLQKNAYVTGYIPQSKAKSYLEKKKKLLTQLIKESPKLDTLTK